MNNFVLFFIVGSCLLKKFNGYDYGILIKGNLTCGNQLVNGILKIEKGFFKNHFLNLC